MVCTLNDLKKRAKEEERKQTNSFVGGQSSGLAVQGPGALGRFLQGQKKAGQAPAAPQELRIEVVMYANGFTVDGGPLRDYQSPPNRLFLLEIKQSRVPAEMLPLLNGRRLVVNLVDNKGETYEVESPSARFEAFTGSGHVLSSPRTPNSIVDSKCPGPYVNPDYPKATVLVRFHNGQKREIEVNMTTRVGVVRDFVATAAPVQGEFELVAGFPLTPVRNWKLTVQEAGIANSTVTQRLIQ